MECWRAHEVADNYQQRLLNAFISSTHLVTFHRELTTLLGIFTLCANLVRLCQCYVAMPFKALLLLSVPNETSQQRPLRVSGKSVSSTKRSSTKRTQHGTLADTVRDLENMPAPLIQPTTYFRSPPIPLR